MNRLLLLSTFVLTPLIASGAGTPLINASARDTLSLNGAAGM